MSGSGIPSNGAPDFYERAPGGAQTTGAARPLDDVSREDFLNAFPAKSTRPSAGLKY